MGIEICLICRHSRNLMLCCTSRAFYVWANGAYAISFADFFYNSDGSVGVGGWVLRGFAIAIGAFGIYRFRTKQNQCSIDSKRKKKNLILVGIIIIVLGLVIFLSLEKWSSWYFDTYVVPAKQEELNRS
jgi:hypothetical protein